MLITPFSLMTLKETIRRDLMVIEADLENPYFTWDGEDYICSHSGTKTFTRIQEGSVAVERGIVFIARKEVFADSIYPKGMEYLTFEGRRYVITAVDSDAFGVSLRIACVEDNRGAHA